KRIRWDEWLTMAGGNAVGLAPNIIFNDYQLVVQAALAGEGIALGWSLTAQLLLKNRLLVPVLDKHVPTGNAFFLVADDKKVRNAEFNNVVTWILSETTDLR